jgi:hypothetical protein
MAEPDAFADFDPFASERRKPASPAGALHPETDAFANFDPFASEKPQTTLLGTAARSFIGGFGPAMAGLPPAAAGAAIGARIGGLPGAVIGLGIGGAAGFAASYGTALGQDWALNHLPQIRDMLGQSEEIKRLDEKEHPIASFLGGLAPYALTMSPGTLVGQGLKKLPTNATTWQRLQQHQLTSRLFSGAIVGGMQLGQELTQEDKVSWQHVAIATGFGMIWNKPTRLGEMVSEFGAKPIRMIFGPRDAPSPLLLLPYYPKPGGPLTPDVIIPEMHPTQARINHVVAGPGMDEWSYMHWTSRSPETEFPAIRMAGDEEAVLGPDDQKNLEARARRYNPELFARRDFEQRRYQALNDYINSQNDPSHEQYAYWVRRREAAERELVAYKKEHGDWNGPRGRQLNAEIKFASQNFALLEERAAAWREGRAVETPELAAARRNMLDAQQNLWDISREVKLELRGAAERDEFPIVHPPIEEPAPPKAPPAPAAAPPVEAKPPEAPAPPAPPAAPAPMSAAGMKADKAKIEKDWEGQLVAQGRGVEEARIAGILMANQFAELAQHFPEAGGALHLYEEEKPTFKEQPLKKKAEVTRKEPPPTRPAVIEEPKVPTTRRELAELLAREPKLKVRAGGPVAAAAETVDLTKIPEDPVERRKWFAKLTPAQLAQVSGAPRAPGGTTFIPKPEPEPVGAPAAEAPAAPAGEAGPLFGPVEQAIDAADAAKSQNELMKEILGLADEAEALGEKGYADAMRLNASGKLGAIKPETLQFYRERVASWKAQKGVTGPVREDYGIEDILKPDLLQFKDFNRILSLKNPRVIADLFQRATDKFRSLVEEINAAGFKFAEAASSFNVPENVSKARQDASAIGGTVMRLLNGLHGAKGDINAKRVQDDIAELDRTIREGMFPPAAAPAPTPAPAVPETPPEPPPAAAAPAVEPPARAPIPGPIPASGIQEFRPEDIIVDAKRFQFKADSDEAGITDRLKGVTQWDPYKSGVLILWRDKEGKLYVADGHQRVALAKRLAAQGQNPMLAARVLDEAAGTSDKEARVIAAMKNISEGTGTALDAAKVLRDHPERAKEIPPNSELFRQAQGLAKLGDDAWYMAINGVVPPNYAAIVGRLTPDPIMQKSIMDVLYKAEPANVTQAESIVRQAIEAGIAKREAGAQGGLFGDEDAAVNLFLDRAKILDRAMKDFKRDKTVFNVLSKEDKIIEAAGNKLAKELNEKRAIADAQAIQVLQVLANRAGPISAALGRAAESLRAGASIAAATRAFVDEFRPMVESGELARLADDVKRGPTHLGDEASRNLVDPNAQPVDDAKSKQASDQIDDLFGGGAPSPSDRDSLLEQRKRRRLKPGEEVFGDIEFDERGRGIVGSMKKADHSTIFHEIAHDILMRMMRFAQHPDAPQQLRNDAAIVLNFLGVDHPNELMGEARRFGNVTRRYFTDAGQAAHEKFAKSFEQYLYEGRAPSHALQRVFDQVRNLLVRVYGEAASIGILPDEMRGVYDRLHVSQQDPTIIAPALPDELTIQDHHAIDAQVIGPEAAGPGFDHVKAEDRRYAEENQEVDASVEGKAREAGIQTEEPRGEGEGEPGRPGEVERDREPPEPQPARGGVREEPRPEPPSRPDVGREGAPVPAAERPEREQPLAPEPAADTIDTDRDDGTVDKAGNVRPENLTDQASVWKALYLSAKRNLDFLAARGVKMPKGLMWDLATDLGRNFMDLDEAALQMHLDKLVGGLKDMAPRVLAARRLLKQSATIVADLAAKHVQRGDDASAGELAVAITRHDMIQSAISGATASWGRTGSAFHDISGVDWNNKTADEINQLLIDNTGRTLFQIKQMAKVISQFSNTPQVSKLVSMSKNVNYGRMVLEMWINGLISGPATHLTYSIGNAILSAQKVAIETPLAAGISEIRRALGRQGETVRIGEVAAAWEGLKRSMGPATLSAVEAWEKQSPTMLPGEDARTAQFLFPLGTSPNAAVLNEAATLHDSLAKVFGLMEGLKKGVTSGAALQAAGGMPGAPLLAWEMSPHGWIPNVAYRGGYVPFGDIYRVPGRAVTSLHSFFRPVNYLMELHQLAYRQAANEGLLGSHMDARIAQLLDDPVLMEKAHQAANDLTLMGQGGAFTKALSQLVNWEAFAKKDEKGNVIKGSGLPILKFIDPFIHISSAIITESIGKRTPIGLLSLFGDSQLSRDLRGLHGNARQDMAMARMVAGTGLSLLFGFMAAEGYVTGSEPSNPQDAAIWRQVYQAHSIKIGDVWYDYHRLGPMGMLLGVAADLYEVAHQAERGEMVKAAAALAHAVTQNILDESFMRGPSDLIKMLSDPVRYGPAYTRNMVGSFLPFSVLSSQLARDVDPYAREARTIMDTVRSKIPGLSMDLLPRRDVWGEPIPSRSALGFNATAIWEQRVNNDPVARTLLELGMHVDAAGRTIRNVQLTDEQHDDWARLSGRLTKLRLDTIVRAPSFQSLPPELKHDMIIEQIRQAREVARNMMFMKYPSLLVDAEAVKLAKRKGPQQ